MKQRDPASANSAAAVSVYWKELNAREKAIYFQMATDDKFRYYKEKNEYDNAMQSLIERDSNPEEMERKPTGNFNLAESDAASVHQATGSADNRKAQGGSSLPRDDDDVPIYSRESMALLASKLDAKSIAFLIKALK